ncbi:MAS20 protein import receptor-domain-containing protein [Spinellus fusiger]|nr:MAS20 protein import receptor-domain-containing protein [Spinellus fusiger]
MKPQTAALATAGVLATAGIGYLVYFDYKRRNDPQLKKKIRRERKKAVKEVQDAETKAKEGVVQLIEAVIETVNKEVFPESAEEKEQYFLSKVAEGEALCSRGEAFYQQSVLPFYAALKVYPAPLELIMIYQKSLPEPVFHVVVSIMALEQQKRQNGFYEEFPPKNTHVCIGELPAGVSADNKPIIRRGLVAREAIEEGQTLYVESPLVSALHPCLEGSYCHHCLKKVNEEPVQCTNCDKVVFCSAECQIKAIVEYHGLLCTHTKLFVKDVANKETIFLNYAITNNVKYPQMIAQFLACMISEEEEKKKAGKAAENAYSSWDHVDKYRYLDTVPSEITQQEMNMIKDVMSSKVPGMDEFLSEEIYLMLKGKLGYNTYPIPAVEGDQVHSEPSNERLRELPLDRPTVGNALYKISTYIGHSEENPNVKLVFGENHDVTVVALAPIKEGEELLASYVLKANPETAE